ncbi:MAG TPA: hypothetical protein VGB49_03785 [Caulobacteraceae bacterium]
MADPRDSGPSGGQSHDDLDHLVGFASPGSLHGRERPRPPVVTAPVASPPPPPPAFDPIPPVQHQPLAQPAAGDFRSRAEQRRAAEQALDRTGFVPCASVYVLIIGAVLFGVSIPFGLFIAHTSKRGATPWIRSHYVYQIRTLWIAVAVAVIGAVTVLIGLGVFILSLLAAWMVLRGAYGVVRLMAGKAMTRPETWLI